MIPYLRDAELSAYMTERPQRAFVVPPRLYTVVDGDTLRIVARADGNKEAFRVRFHTIDAPEAPKRTDSDRILYDLGVDVHADRPGRAATALVRRICKGRALLIEPQKGRDGSTSDKFGRLLGRITASGQPGPLFVPRRSIPVEAVLHRRGLGRIMEGVPSPEIETDLMRALRRRDAPGADHVEDDTPEMDL